MRFFKPNIEKLNLRGGGQANFDAVMTHFFLTVPVSSDRQHSAQTEQLVEEAQKSPRIAFKIRAHYILGLALNAKGFSEDAQVSFKQAPALAQKHGHGLVEQQIVTEVDKAEA
ncbi:hypothetical protein ACFL27_05520 [candidate division CSSED10-310 bacterium]|uniref:Uncharacterized protein n=1 Tax=candidate division CSSED10-310 bacterium TaxID=2855610 RepID=A0ABV6YTX9_UNCC1